MISCDMMTSSNGNIFRVTGPLCGEFTGPGEFPTQRPVTRNFDVFFDLHLNERLSKQSQGWWFETPQSCSLWRHGNDAYIIDGYHRFEIHMHPQTVGAVGIFQDSNIHSKIRSAIPKYHAYRSTFRLKLTDKSPTRQHIVTEMLHNPTSLSW